MEPLGARPETQSCFPSLDPCVRISIGPGRAFALGKTDHAEVVASYDTSDALVVPLMVRLPPATSVVLVVQVMDATLPSRPRPGRFHCDAALLQ